MSRWFWIKAGLAALGVVLALTGMALAYRPFVWTAIALLGAAFLARLVERRASTSENS